MIDPRLLESIEQGDCVAFVGAGFSAPAKLPQWRQLLRLLSKGLPKESDSPSRQLVAELLRKRRAGTNRELEMAAQLLFDELGDEPYRRGLAGALQTASLPPVMRERLRLLYGIPFRAIVTTNFDPLIPGAPPSPETYRRLLREPSRTPWDDEITRAVLQEDRAEWQQSYSTRPVVQLHGSLESAESLVFTRAQYRHRLYGSPAYLTVLRALLATSTVLFLGYSLTDAYLNELRAELVETFFGEDTGGDPLAWAVLADVSEVARRYYEKHEGLGVLAYATSDGGFDHSGFDTILRAIYSQTYPVHRLGRAMAGRRMLWLDPNPHNNDLGRRLLAAAVGELHGGPREVAEHLVEVETIAAAIEELQGHPFDLVISHWGHGLGAGGHSNAEELLRWISKHRAQGTALPPVVVFASPSPYEAANRQRALSLGAMDLVADWRELMTVLERTLSALPDALGASLA